MKELFRLGVTLMIICLVAGAGLAAVYAQTKPVIDQRAEEDLVNAAKGAIPGAEKIMKEESEGVEYWVGTKGEQIVGYAMNVDAWGFGKSDPIRIMVGMEPDGKIGSVQVISANETPGIGMKVKEEKYTSKFAGTENPMGVDGITGATVSCNAVKNGVNAAREFLLIASGANAPDEPIDLALVPDGDYDGVGFGFMDDIKVRVSVSGGRLTDVKVLSHSDTPTVSAPAIKGVPQAMVTEQKVEVDAVSGATFTSKGIVEAVRNALEGTQE